MLSKDELNAIEDRASRATPGPWLMKQEGADFYMADSQGRYLDITLADAIFAAHSRQDIPALLDEVERLEADNARLRAALEDIAHGPVGYWNNPEYRAETIRQMCRKASEALKGGAK